MLRMFEAALGGFDFSVFDAAGANGKRPMSDLRSLYGKLVLILYLILASLLLLNLLIAIVTNRYKPDEVRPFPRPSALRVPPAPASCSQPAMPKLTNI